MKQLIFNVTENLAVINFDYLINMIENNVPPVPTIDEIQESFNAVLQADVAIKKFIKI